MISFIEFLKTRTSIPNIFIDELFKLIGTDDIDNPLYIIKFSDVIEWLDIKAHNAKKTLLKNFTKNIHYIIKSTSKKKYYNKDDIFVTIDTFKKYCLLTNSKKGDMMRNYFIEIEKTLSKYKGYIIKEQNKQIKQLQHNLKPALHPEKGIIYIFETPNNPGNSLYKIGRSKNLKKRLSTHQSALSHNIKILYIFESDNIKVIEECIKTFLKQYQYRKYKEVYQCNIDIIKMMIKECDELKTKVKYKTDIIKSKEKNNNYFVSIYK